MTGTITICDNCKKEWKQMAGITGGLCFYDWITVGRSASNSSNAVGAGVYHFCCDECLINYLNSRKNKNAN